MNLQLLLTGNENKKYTFKRTHHGILFNDTNRLQFMSKSVSRTALNDVYFFGFVWIFSECTSKNRYLHYISSFTRFFIIRLDTAMPFERGNNNVCGENVEIPRATIQNGFGEVVGDTETRPRSIPSHVFITSRAIIVRWDRNAMCHWSTSKYTLFETASTND